MPGMGTIWFDIQVKLDKLQQALKTAQDKISTMDSAIEKKLKSVGKTFTSAGKKLTLGVSTPLLAAGVAAVKAAGDFESMGYTFQAVSGATSEQMQKMSQLAKELGADITLPGTSATDAAAAMTELVKAGVSIEDTFKAAKGTLQLSAAAQIDNAEAATIVGQALNAFKLSGDKAVMVADLLANSANASAGEMTDMAYALQAGASVAAMANQSISDFTTAISLMANAGIVGSDAGTSLKSMFMRLIAPTDKAAETMAQFGIKVFDAHGKMLPLPEIIAQFSTKLGGLSQEQRNAALATIFGSDAIRAANIVLMGGTDAWNQMSAAVNKAGGAQEVAGSKMKGFNGALEAFKSTVETLAVSIGEKLLPIITPIIQKITDIIGKFDSLSPAIQQAILIFGGLGIVIGPLLVVLGNLATAIGTIGLPVTGVIVAIALLIGWLAKLWLSGDEGKDKITTAFTSIWNTITSVWNKIMAFLGPIIEAFKQSFAILVAWIQPIWQNMLGLFNELKPVFQQIWAVVGPILSLLGSAFVGVINGIIAALGPFVDAIISAIRFIVNIIGFFIALIRGDWSAAWDFWMKAGQAALNMFMSLFKAVWNFIDGLIKGIIAFFKGLWAALVGNSIIPDIVNGILYWFRLLQSLGTAIWNGIKDFIIGLWNGIKAAASTVWEGIKTVIMTPINALSKLLSGAWEGIKAVASNLWNGLKNTASTVWDGIKNVIMAPINSISGLLSGVWSSITTTASNAWNGLKKVASDIFNKVKDAILSPFKNLHIPLPHFKFSSKQVSVAGIKFPVPDVDIDWYKTGGIFTQPQIIGVGEAGSEAVLPIDRLSDLIADAMRKTGGMTYQQAAPIMYVQNLTVRNDQDIDRISQAIYNENMKVIRAMGRRAV